MFQIIRIDPPTHQSEIFWFKSCILTHFGLTDHVRISRLFILSKFQPDPSTHFWPDCRQTEVSPLLYLLCALKIVKYCRRDSFFFSVLQLCKTLILSCSVWWRLYDAAGSGPNAACRTTTWWRSDDDCWLESTKPISIQPIVWITTDLLSH